MTTNQRLEALFEPSVTALGYEIWHCEVLSLGQQKILRLLIDSDAGVNADACASISRQISAILDVEDVIQGRYTLEVSSPGLDRPLVKPEHFSRYINRSIKCKLRAAQAERRSLRGQLQGCDAAGIRLETEDGVFDIAFSNIDKANLIPDL